MSCTTTPGPSGYRHSVRYRRRLVYRGRVEVDSLAVLMRTTLEATGWRHISTTSTGDHGIVQVYEKSGNPLEVHLIDGWWFTYVELTASRALEQATK